MEKKRIEKIRDWLGFFFTMAGFILSISNKIQINIQIQYYVSAEAYIYFQEKDDGSDKSGNVLLNIRFSASCITGDSTNGTLP